MQDTNSGAIAKSLWNGNVLSGRRPSDGSRHTTKTIASESLSIWNEDVKSHFNLLLDGEVETFFTKSLDLMM